MDSHLEALAALNALGMLENDEKRALDGAIAREKDLRLLNSALEQTVAELGHLIAPVEPPADMKKRIRAKLRSRGAKTSTLSPGLLLGGLGWLLAVGLAVLSATLWQSRAKLTQQVAAASQAIAPVVGAASAEDDGNVRTLAEELKKLRDDFEAKQTALNQEVTTARASEKTAQGRITQLTAEVATLKEQSEQAAMKVLTLPASTVWEYRRGEMLVVWDRLRRQGVLMLDKMPKVESGRDYQLWIVDPQQPDPVSAGVVAVDAKGAAQIQFKPATAVNEASKFILSLEKKDGAAKREGEILISGP